MSEVATSWTAAVTAHVATGTRERLYFYYGADPGRRSRTWLFAFDFAVIMLIDVMLNLDGRRAIAGGGARKGSGARPNLSAARRRDCER